MQNLNLSFADIRTKGQYMKLTGDGLEGESDEAIAWARETLVSSRGRELPETSNPMLVGDLFRLRSTPREHILKCHLEEV